MARNGSLPRAVAAVGGFVGLLLLLAAAGCGGNGAFRPPGTLTGTITKSGHTWHCRRRVDLDLVQVTIDDLPQDAVHLDRGCTGVIKRLVIVGDGGSLGPGGDGVKIHAGAHDLQILGGEIDCGAKSPGAHQDAIQAMGGSDVTFEHIQSRGCANAFMFVNWGVGKREKPSGIVCRDCNAETRNYSVSIRNSVRSGATGGDYVSRVPPQATPAASDPVLSGNSWAPASNGLNPSGRRLARSAENANRRGTGQ